jgi:DNA-binding Xre family transcriptional regulator
MKTTVYEELLAKHSASTEFKLEVDVQLGLSQVLNAMDQIRLKKGWTKADLARAANMHPANLRKLMSTGQRNFEVETLLRLVSALGGKLEISEGSSPSEEKLPSAHRALKPEGKTLDQSLFV